jgi:hypothetical protein
MLSGDNGAALFIRPNRRGVKRVKRHSLKTDMTPLVDLGFLLIAFFVVTAKLSEPHVADLNMPHDDGPPIEVEESNTLTVLLGDKHVYYYHGKWEQAEKTNGIYETSFQIRGGIGDVIRTKQKHLDNIKVNGEGRKGLMLLIKPAPNSEYEEVIEMLDQVLLHEVGKYALVSLSNQEKSFLLER